MSTQKRKNPVQIFAEDVTDEDMESITKIAQSAFQLPFSDFQESRVFTKIADFIRQKLNKQFGECVCESALSYLVNLSRNFPNLGHVSSIKWYSTLV